MLGEVSPVIQFPDPSQANEEGLLAAGGDLQPQTLLAAYSKGIFPWYAEDQPILWWSPDPRMVLFPAEFHCSRRLARRMHQNIYAVSFDEGFEQVVRGCAETLRRGEHGTWIFPEMITAYMRMHMLGHAHSIEVWEDGVWLEGCTECYAIRSFLLNRCSVNALMHRRWRWQRCVSLHCGKSGR